MTSEVSHVMFRSQDFEAVAIPESGGGVGEYVRLRVAPLFGYEAIFYQYGPRYEFGGAFLFSGAGPDFTEGEGLWQFEVTEEVSEDDPGAVRTLTIQGAEGDSPFESFEIIPLDWESRPVDFTQLEVGARREKISYGKDGPPELLKIRLNGLNVLDVETIAVRLSDSERQYSTEPLAPLIRRDDAIRVDKLSNPAGEKRKAEEHLLALFDALSDKFNGRTFQLECTYQYQPAPDSPYVSLPVMKGQSLRWDAASFSAIAGQLTHWRQTVQTATGVFVFGVTILGTKKPEPVPALQLTQLLLPSESLADGE
jgi:hypothetical protein